MYSGIPTWRERLDELSAQMRGAGHLALVLVDASDLAQVEHDYGSRAFGQVLASVAESVAELQGDGVRASDLLALDDRGGNGFLLFLTGGRSEGRRGPRVADLQALAERIAARLAERVEPLASPYLRRRCSLTVGWSVAFHNPLVVTERVVSRLIGEAWESVRVQKQQAEFHARCQLQDVLLAEQVEIVFQPIVHLQREGVLGFEALARGPAGSPLHQPQKLFDAAAGADLVFELDRHCRRCALDAARALPPPFLLFLNVVPAAMYDPDFRGSELVRLLERVGVPPERIVLEISEQYAIENYELFVEGAQSFEQLGFSLAVDDMGTGYSGLEKIARLDPRYLKFDLQLVREIDSSLVKREMARALKGFADRMGSSIIAEGIETEGERLACAELGIEFGQGLLLGPAGPLESSGT